MKQTYTSEDIETIWVNFGDQLLYFIKSKTPSHQDAEDILQEVFIKIQKNIDGLQDNGKLRSWIYSITRNAIFDFYKKKKVNVEFDDMMLNIPQELNTIDQKKICSCLDKMIEKLPSKYYEALKYVELEGWTQKQLSEVSNISLSGAKSRVQRGKIMLKEMFIECCKPEINKSGNIVEIHTKGKCSKC